MKRKATFAILTLALMGAAYGVTNYALGSQTPPQLRSNLPARNLPVTPLPPDIAGETSSLATSAGMDARYGITPDSYAQARRVATTSLGPLYLIPGTNGACLVFASSMSCGDPGAANEPMLALVALNPATGDAVGGGVTSATITSVTVVSDRGRSLTVGAIDGVFAIDARDAFKFSSSAPLRFVASP